MPDRPLRYADGPTVEVTTSIAAPAERVWDVVADIELPARFSSELRSASWVDGAIGPQVGARFVGRSEHPAVGKWETTSTIVELEPCRVFGWAVGDPQHPSAAWRFTITPTDNGCVLSQWMRMGPARSGINPAIDAMPDREDRILARRLEEHRVNMEATLAGIKAVVVG